MDIVDRPRPVSAVPDWIPVGAGGVVGTFLRAWSVLVAAPFAGWEAWAVAGGNVFGAFVLGYFVAGFTRHHPDGSVWHLFFATGMLGSFTTFSALAVDLLHFAEAGAAQDAAVYLLVSIPGGVMAALTGLAVGGAGDTDEEEEA
jgi:CrcB protein